MGRQSCITVPNQIAKGKKVCLPSNPYYREDINYNNYKPAFSFEYVQEKYCLSKWESKQIKKLIQELGKFEKHTWNDIYQGSIFKYSKVDKNGLKASIPSFITPDVDIYYFKPFGTNTPYRVFGIRDRHNFKFLWFDDKHEIYPGNYR